MLKSYLSVYKFVSKFLKNEKLRKIFSVHPLLVGGNPFSTTSIYALILFLEKKMGSSLCFRRHRKNYNSAGKANERNWS